jgi:hypothetical protein
MIARMIFDVLKNSRDNIAEHKIRSCCCSWKIYKENNLSFNLHIFTSGIGNDEMYFVIKTNIFKKVCNFFRALVIS